MQTWCTAVRDVHGNVLPQKPIGTNQKINWAGDLTTQVTDGANLFAGHKGVINDITHGAMLFRREWQPITEPRAILVS